MVPYQLNVYKVEQVCIFELSWGRGQRLNARLPYPDVLARRYENWQRAYLGYYKNELRNSELRGRTVVQGSTQVATQNWSNKLDRAETALLEDFRQWLQRNELYELRSQLRKAHQHSDVTIFLSCEPLAVARLPWEAWNLLTEVNAERPMKLARAPLNIRAETRALTYQGKPRVLVIWGEDEKLDLSCDQTLLQQYDSLLNLTAIRRQPKETLIDLKQRICKTIADPQGWQMLFFFGHSNEAHLVGGHIAIAPNSTLSMQELTPALQAAQSHGLPFALFNSCSGLDIANRLIELGLSQVAMMREPIHNQVAQVFLAEFLKSLAQWHDVHTALNQVCQTLQGEYKIRYPSASLVPSLFHHPDSIPFRLEPQGWRHWVKRLLPSQRQAVALGIVTLLSVFPAGQRQLLSGRLLAQSVYRQITLQIPQGDPTVTLIQVDKESVRQSPLLNNPKPINRQYLAELIDTLTVQKELIIAIDYALDGLPNNAENRALRSAFEANVNRGSWLVLANYFDLDNNQAVPVNPESKIVEPGWSLQGYINAPERHVVLPAWEGMCYDRCPLTYWLALIKRYQQHKQPDQPHPALDKPGNLSQQVLDSLQKITEPTELQRVKNLQLSGLAYWMQEWFDQFWFYPILDFSIPPDRIFKAIPAHELLEDGSLLNHDWTPGAIVMIGAGGYTEAGVGNSTDNLPLPVAISYWQKQRNTERQALNLLPGLEANAYRVHHLLENHLVLPVPDLWMVALAMLLGKSAALALQNQKLNRRWTVPSLIMATVVYGGLSSQFFVTAKVLLPLVLPATTLWIYLLPVLWRNHSYD